MLYEVITTVAVAVAGDVGVADRDGVSSVRSRRGVAAAPGAAAIEAVLAGNRLGRRAEGQIGDIGDLVGVVTGAAVGTVGGQGNRRLDDGSIEGEGQTVAVAVASDVGIADRDGVGSIRGRRGVAAAPGAAAIEAVLAGDGFGRRAEGQTGDIGDLVGVVTGSYNFV